ncbi:glycosyltransferase family protein [Paludibacillus litoralis]|uniref:glycosyltransferase family protein n=1 Tax=Paludibacillus litoralis TaxID=3133267 RepID=UPI0039B78609
MTHFAGRGAGRIRGADRGRRVVLYSHDTFGLGHLRRSRTIAQALAADDPSLSALITTGSPIVGRFDFADRVDHVRLPGVVKMPDGTYASHNLGLDIEDTVNLRAAILSATEESFDPDLLIIDKEPWGFRNELTATLETAKARGARLVLGLRDVLDEPETLRREWERKDAFTAIETYYDEIWIYGLPEICEPLAGLPISDRMMRTVRYTGYLRRDTPDWPDVGPPPPPVPYVLVTTGGGGDGEALIDWALSAYEADPGIPLHGVLVYGPFMNTEKRADFDRRVAALAGRVTAFSFDPRLERLLADATGVVAMGGYNTFCEILSLDKPAIIAPRVRPRLEQYIRTEAAERLGLLRMLHRPRDGDTPDVMAQAIRSLVDQPPPSRNPIRGLLGGLDTITASAATTWATRAAG